MSFVSLRKCPIKKCKFNKNIVHADFFQTKKHLWHHEYRDLLRTAKSFNSNLEYGPPSKGFLVECLAEFSIIRRN